MLWPQIFNWADRANNVFLARSYVFSFVARCDPPFWTGNGCAGRERKGRGERRRWKAKSELRLGCLPINLLLLTTTSVMKCKQHQSQILSPPCSAPPPSKLNPPSFSLRPLDWCTPSLVRLNCPWLLVLMLLLLLLGLFGFWFGLFAQ